ncbi:GntR family transcriptional regulator [Bradyrhizobium sp. NP1]|uniref:GntR family transcriptional regulator n=1 Tax=Bradyrhizobium sp. NP1 TaxID=3049772 RepID=UPI0025A6475D|nr:GntR family transcriptional regulator [Bradyrhizobium sp. NP1]WJR75849.1 GntR family transcriptional regulator [Bradyrhizobium sp. NP1]
MPKRKAASGRNEKTFDWSTTLLRTHGGLPLYAQLLTVFRRRIENGEWAVGKRIPTLRQLVDELDVARVTVRHAIGLLQEEGLIGSYPGSGTYVLKRPDSPIWYRIPLTWEKLVGTTPDIEIVSLIDRRAEHPPSPFHGKGKVAQDYHFMRRLLLRHHIPYGIGATYVEENLFQKIGRDAFNLPVPLRLIDTHLKGEIGDTEQTVRAGIAEAEVASLLGLSSHAPVMIVTRSILSKSGVLLYESMGTFRGDFVEIHTEFNPDEKCPTPTKNRRSEKK